MKTAKRFMVYGLSGFGLLFMALFAPLTINHLPYTIPSAQAIVNPTSVPNNKFGIHIISAASPEASDAASLVNSKGDWGYITVLIESKDRDQNKWNSFFNELRERHLIPIVRLATKPKGDNWEVPYEGEEVAWADFLNNLTWPTKNRYVTIYNEPNQAQEWNGTVNAASYAKVLDKTITALKLKSPDFFVMNAGLDASAPEKMPAYGDEVNFLKEMNQTVPGIFEKLDGWVSHSYPNPGFIGSPNASGRGSVKTWEWELQTLSKMGVKKTLPVFITETGWKHAEGVNLDQSLPSSELVSQYYQTAFEKVWNDPRIIAVTPFLLSYQEAPFDHFSFKKITGEKQTDKILGISNPPYYDQYQTLKDLPKVTGQPLQDFDALLIKGEVYKTIVAGQSYTIPIILKNTGQSIWNEQESIKLVAIQGGDPLSIQPIILSPPKKVKPGEQYTFDLKMISPQAGTYDVILNLFHGTTQFDSPPLEFSTTVSNPVDLKVKAKLGWKDNFSGNYILSAVGIVNKAFTTIVLGKDGESESFEDKQLVPDYSYDFTLQKPFYQPQTIHETLHSGDNELDFGTLKPDIGSAILHPSAFWQLLPFSN